MSFTKNKGRQEILSAYVDFDAVDVDVSGTQEVIDLPPNAIVVGGDLVVGTVSDNSGAHTLALGDSASAARYLAATSLKAAARTALTLTGYVHLPTTRKLIATLVGNGDATAGAARLRVDYIVKNRAAITQD